MMDVALRDTILSDGARSVAATLYREAGLVQPANLGYVADWEGMLRPGTWDYVGQCAKEHYADALEQAAEGDVTATLALREAYGLPALV